MSIAFGDLAWLALAVIVAGVATGVLAGMFGVGGGAIAVLAVVGWVILKYLTAPPRAPETAAPAVKVATTAPGSNPIDRPADRSDSSPVRSSRLSQRAQPSRAPAAVRSGT